jgi:hypothetical protein
MLSVLGLLGIALLVIGLFLPWQIWSPRLPPSVRPMTAVLWWRVRGWVLILLVVSTQLVASLAGLLNLRRRVIFAVSLACVIFALLFYLFDTRIEYCLFYCGGYLYRMRGVKMLGAGFWILLAGFLATTASSLALLLTSGKIDRKATALQNEDRR